MMMINVRTLQKAFIFSAKGVAWLLYAAFLEYCVHNITMYLFREPEGDNDALFFTEKDNECWIHVARKVPCGNDCSYTKIRRILGYMRSAKERLDLCIYHITAFDFSAEILNAYNRGIKIRFLTDGNRLNGTGSQALFLKAKGIPMKMIKNSYEMHHKFFIADGKTLVNCSSNWTMQGFTGNSEDVVICSEKEIVEKYEGHFNVLWEKSVA